MKLTTRTTVFQQFKTLVAQCGWTLAELRCDVRPSEELLKAIPRDAHLTCVSQNQMDFLQNEDAEEWVDASE